MKKCRRGYYYCYKDKKCKRIPTGYRIGLGGYLRKDHGDEKDDSEENENVNGNSNEGSNGGGVSEGTLHKWFKGSKSKDGKGGWVNVLTGGTCASDEPGEGVPKCVSRSKYDSMTPAERRSAARRKKKADPGQQKKFGAAKPTYVSTDKPKKKMRKEEVQVTEAKDKKGKGSGKKDACYHKVKSRYSVWPSAYASGALVKCRKKGAANWGESTNNPETWEKAKKNAEKTQADIKKKVFGKKKNLTNSYDYSNWREDFKAMEYEFIDIIEAEPLVAEASFEINPQKHREEVRAKKIRDRTKTGDEGSEIAKKKVKGPKLMGEDKYSDLSKHVSRMNLLNNPGPRSTPEQSAAQKKRLEKKHGMKLDDHPQFKKEEVDKRRAPKELLDRLNSRMVGWMADDGPNKPAYDAKQRLLKKAYEKRKRKRMEEEVESIDEAGKKCWKGYKKKGTQKLFGKTYNRCIKANEEKEESKIGGGNLKKLTGKSVKRVDADVDGDVDTKDMKSSETGEFVPSPTGKKLKPKVRFEGTSDWRSELIEAIDKSKMKCNSPKAQAVGDSQTGKSHVVKACEGGKEKILRFGQRGVKGSPKKKGESKEYASRRKRFKKRHAKNIAKGKMSAAYWSNVTKW